MDRLKGISMIFLNEKHTLRCAMNFHYCLFDVNNMNIRCVNMHNVN